MTYEEMLKLTSAHHGRREIDTYYKIKEIK